MSRLFTQRLVVTTLAVAVFGLLLVSPAPAQAAPNLALPSVNIGISGANTPQQTATSLQILFLMTVLSLAPAILVMMTSFTRVIIVLSFVRQALSTQQMPPNQVLVGLALFLTFFIMAPTWNQVNQQALQPYLSGKITQEVAMEKAAAPIRTFMFKQTREKDLALFVNLSKTPRPKTYKDIPTMVLIPAFAISELKTAFQIGFMLFIPFVVIDMIVSSSLMAMGMMMLPPMMISLPIKLLVFVLVDGWHLIVKSLVLSFS
ncbi:MAG TPA: flagellar type III secretion system pore protein FliP [Bacillota bacterium]|nr:flagellar type III secretion system pore protein FliP [Bacillota bacterium]